MAPASTSDKYPPPEAFKQSITIIVGSGVNQETFNIHKGVVGFYSGYFEGALRGTFAEALSCKIRLAEEDATTFSLFVHWLYTRKIHVSDEAADHEQTFETLCDLWLFADRRQVPLLMNACIDALRDAIVKAWVVPTS
ncbi:hypothetical protein HII31_02360 [Pseudocercospora fuligena]|uniref:BTB domain-containing protein n=1 Tax=Pseudocercospora fuligena TaxID=685502 RepID=A0A8H6RS30_9PEZI|nr:hypothetical protein HII31_02360 [Pseudocercospora fuligena]